MLPSKIKVRKTTNACNELYTAHYYENHNRDFVMNITETYKKLVILVQGTNYTSLHFGILFSLNNNITY